MKRIFCLVLIFTVAFGVASPAIQLPSFNVDSSRLTVSGMSSGACFATQFHVAYSSVISGMGTWAGVPNLCYAKDGLLCMSSPGIVNTATLISDTDKLADQGKIDPTDNLANDRVYLFHGTKDTTVHPEASDKIAEYYESYLSNPSIDLVKKMDLPSTHAVVSDHVGTNCGHSDDRLYLENCDFDSVFDMLGHIMGMELNPALTPGSMNGNLVEFDQTEFFPGGDADGSSMDQTGFYYLPPSCQGSVVTCKLHIFFHGCAMGQEYIGTEFIETAGFIEVADANNIILLFPQVIKKSFGGNPFGCWNWFGYLGDLIGEKYAQKDADQMLAVFKMIERAANL